MKDTLRIIFNKIIAAMGKVKWLQGANDKPDEEDKSLLKLDEYISRGVDRHDSDNQ
jgi:hypothetical protein